MDRWYMKFGWLLGAMLLVSAWAYAQDDMRVVDNAAFGQPQRPPARFDHDTHNDTAALDDCAECHHVYDENGKKDDYESSEDQMCADCHALKPSGRVPGLRRAFHLNCKGCHLQLKKGPVTCEQCHVRGAASGSDGS